MSKHRLEIQIEVDDKRVADTPALVAGEIESWYFDDLADAIEQGIIDVGESKIIGTTEGEHDSPVARTMFEQDRETKRAVDTFTGEAGGGAE